MTVRSSQRDSNRSANPTCGERAIVLATGQRQAPCSPSSPRRLTTGSDSALIQLCDQFRAELEAHVADVKEEGEGAIPMRVINRRVSRREKCAAAIACLPAVTEAGLKAKAAVIAYYHSIFVQEFDMEISQLIAASLAADLLR